MSSPLGSLEELVLLAVCGLPGEAYAVAIQRHLALAGKRDIAMGAVYSTLDRLEKKGFLRSSLGSVTHARGGRRKRFYEITGPGTHAVAWTRKSRQGLSALVDPDLKPDLGIA